MTYVIKMRGAPTATEVCEFECPTHGRYVTTVDRPAPDAVHCPMEIESAEGVLTECGIESPWRISAPGFVKVKVAEFSQGKNIERPPADVMLDTRDLGDGMPMHEWRAKQDAIRKDMVYKRAKAVLGRS